MSGCLKFGLIGHNISYSKSAEIFKVIFDITAMDGSFENFDLNPGQFNDDFHKVIAKGISGLSVTIPFKKLVIGMLNDITKVARSLNSVNSIAIKGKELSGDNTDISGFLIPLKPHKPLLKKGHALILGCGGSAKAAAYSLYSEFKISEFTVLGRSAEKLVEFENSLKPLLLNATITKAKWHSFGVNSSSKYAIVVNCTPLGGWNHTHANPLPIGYTWNMTQIYYDLNYNSDITPVRQAAKNNVIAIDGSQMLVGQALRSFEIWTGKTVSFDEVYERVFERPTTLPD